MGRSEHEQQVRGSTGETRLAFTIHSMNNHTVLYASSSAEALRLDSKMSARGFVCCIAKRLADLPRAAWSTPTYGGPDSPSDACGVCFRLRLYRCRERPLWFGILVVLVVCALASRTSADCDKPGRHPQRAARLGVEGTGRAPGPHERLSSIGH